MKTALQYIPGLRFESLTDVNERGNNSFTKMLSSLFTSTNSDSDSDSDNKTTFSDSDSDSDKDTNPNQADIYFFVNASTVELPLLQVQR